MPQKKKPHTLLFTIFIDFYFTLAFLLSKIQRIPSLFQEMYHNFLYFFSSSCTQDITMLTLRGLLILFLQLHGSLRMHCLFTGALCGVTQAVSHVSLV